MLTGVCGLSCKILRIVLPLVNECMVLKFLRDSEFQADWELRKVGFETHLGIIVD